MLISAHLGHMWQDVPLLDRIFMAGHAGFDGVDIPFPYDFPAKDIQRALMSAGVRLVSIACPPPNYTGGERGFAALPGMEKRFQTDVRRAMRYADALGVPMVHVLTGPCGPHDATDALATLTRNLRWAVHQVGPRNLLVGAEPDTALSDPGQAHRLIDEIDHPNLFLRVEALPTAQLCCSVPEVISSYGAQIGGVAVSRGGKHAKPCADDPALAAVLQALATASYKGWISATYAVGAKDPNAFHWREMVDAVR